MEYSSQIRAWTHLHSQWAHPWHLSQLLLRFAACFLGLLIFSSCIHDKASEPSPEKPLAVEPDKKPPTPEPAPQKLTPAEEKDLVKIREWTVLLQPLTEADREFLRDPGPLPPQGSTKEAVISLGIAKLVQTRGVGPSLEQYARYHRLSYPEILKQNSYLKGVDGAKLVVEALQKVAVSDDFYVKVVSALREQAQKWPQDAPPVDTILPPPPGNLAIPFAPRGGPSGPQVPGVGGPLIAGTGTSAEPTDKEILDAAEALSDQGLFQEAILKVDKVSQQSPMRLVAIQKVKEYSQSGIQALRRKAAQAFQNASVAPDDRTKFEYLRTARQNLEDGLIMYPDAPQAATVRENLKAITMQLKMERPIRSP